MSKVIQFQPKTDVGASLIIDGYTYIVRVVRSSEVAGVAKLLILQRPRGTKGYLATVYTDGQITCSHEAH
jgi:hypothetical protein